MGAADVGAIHVKELEGLPDALKTADALKQPADMRGVKPLLGALGDPSILNQVVQDRFEVEAFLAVFQEAVAKDG
jgi:hypothetical protein